MAKINRRDALKAQAAMVASVPFGLWPHQELYPEPELLPAFKCSKADAITEDICTFKADMLQKTVKLDYKGRLNWYRATGQPHVIVFVLDWEKEGTFHVSNYAMDMKYFLDEEFDVLKEEIRVCMNWELEDYIHAVRKA